jgi:hypothetical protein
VRVRPVVDHEGKLLQAAPTAMREKAAQAFQLDHEEIRDFSQRRPSRVCARMPSNLPVCPGCRLMRQIALSVPGVSSLRRAPGKPYHHHHRRRRRELCSPRAAFARKKRHSKLNLRASLIAVALVGVPGRQPAIFLFHLEARAHLVF